MIHYREEDNDEICTISRLHYSSKTESV